MLQNLFRGKKTYLSALSLHRNSIFSPWSGPDPSENPPATVSLRYLYTFAKGPWVNTLTSGPAWTLQRFQWFVHSPVNEVFSTPFEKQWAENNTVSSRSILCRHGITCQIYKLEWISFTHCMLQILPFILYKLNESVWLRGISNVFYAAPTVSVARHTYESNLCVAAVRLRLKLPISPTAVRHICSVPHPFSFSSEFKRFESALL